MSQLQTNPQPLANLTVFDIDYNVINRNLDWLGGYCEDTAFYFSTVSGKSIDLCRQWVKDNVVPVDRPIYQTIRHENGDREGVYSTVSKYFRDVVSENLIMSPNGTGYLPPSTKRSLSADYIQTQLDMRALAKKEKFAATMAGDKVKAAIKENEQQTRKIKANSLSGIQLIDNCILRNKTAHSSLTSLCRTVTTTTNATNERFLRGNRHYYSPEVVIANISNILRNTDINQVASVLFEFGLRCPTTQEVLDAIYECCQRYWRDPDAWDKIVQYVSKLSDVQLAAYLYTQDMHHMRVMNEEVIRNFYKGMITRVKGSIDNYAEIIKTFDDDLIGHVSLVCADVMMYRDIGKIIRSGDVEVASEFALTGQAIKLNLQKHERLIRTFWLTNNMPPSIALFPASRRKAIVGSDTDSSIFTVQQWVEWYVGEINFEPESIAVASATVFMCIKLIAHMLRLLSINLGIPKDQIDVIVMKNEYLFPVFALTGIAKHYYAMIMAQEGNVYKEMVSEIKGVNLRDAKTPVEVRKKSDKLIRDIMESIFRGEKLNLKEMLTYIADIERDLIKSYQGENINFYKGMEIKQEKTYANPMSGPYASHDMWEKVFANKYGPAPQLPYPAVKIPVDVKGTAMKEWVAKIEDKEISENLGAWLESNGKKQLSAIYIPRANAEMHGVPVELQVIIEARKAAYTAMVPFYRIMDSFKIHLGDKKFTKMVSDFH